jgi:hypothetical protein
MPVDRLVVFTLAANRFAIRLGEVAGVAEPAGVRRIPGQSGPVIGLTRWRGRILTVLDLSRLLGVDARPRRGSLVRLRPPFDRTALWIPAPIEIRTAVVQEESTTVEEPSPVSPGEHDEVAPRLLDTRTLLTAAAAEVRHRGWAQGGMDGPS